MRERPEMISLFVVRTTHRSRMAITDQVRIADNHRHPRQTFQTKISSETPKLPSEVVARGKTLTVYVAPRQNTKLCRQRCRTEKTVR